MPGTVGKHESIKRESSVAFGLTYLRSALRCVKIQNRGSVAVFSRKELFALFDVRLDRSTAFVPVRGTHLTVLLEVLEGLDHSERLIHASAQRQVVHHLMANNAGFVDQKQTSKCDTAVKQHIVIPGNLLVQIGDQWVIGLADSALITSRVGPRQVREVTVDRYAQNLNAQLCEIFRTIAEGNDLSGADKREIQWPEKQQDVLVLVVAEGDFFELTIRHDGLCSEIRSLLGYQNTHRELFTSKDGMGGTKILCVTPETPTQQANTIEGF